MANNNAIPSFRDHLSSVRARFEKEGVKPTRQEVEGLVDEMRHVDGIVDQMDSLDVLRDSPDRYLTALMQTLEINVGTEPGSEIRQFAGFSEFVRPMVDEDLPNGGKGMTEGQKAAFRAEVEERQPKLGDVVAAAPVTPHGQVASRMRSPVSADLPELKQFAEQQGWLAKGWTHLSVLSQRVQFSTDEWQTSRELSSTDVPSPLVDGAFVLPQVGPGTVVDFKVTVEVAASKPGDLTPQARGTVLLDDGGEGYVTQTR